MFEHVVFPSLGPSILSWSTDVAWGRLGNSSWVSASRVSNEGHGPSLHVHKGMVTEGNGLHVTGQSISEETEATRFFRISGAQAGERRSGSRG